MILGISGRKQSGKNTTANIIHGMVLKDRGLVQDWNINADGTLMVDLSDGTGWGEFDVTRQDKQFSEWAEQNMWPYIKMYSFADHLKWICVKLFDVPFECCFGTDEQKNELQEHLLWENMLGVCTNEKFFDFMQSKMEHDLAEDEEDTGYKLIYHEPRPMTAREFLQFLGTDVMRKMYEPIWVNSCIKKIQQEQPELAIIADVRFPNEAKAIEQASGKVVRLTREVYEDAHSSEVALDNYPFTDYIDNKIESIDILMVKVKEFYRNLKEQNASNLC